MVAYLLLYLPAAQALLPQRALAAFAELWTTHTASFGRSPLRSMTVCFSA